MVLLAFSVVLCQVDLSSLEDRQITGHWPISLTKSAVLATSTLRSFGQQKQTRLLGPFQGYTCQKPRRHAGKALGHAIGSAYARRLVWGVTQLPIRGSWYGASVISKSCGLLGHGSMFVLNACT